jgi:hypothetical protein
VPEVHRVVAVLLTRRPAQRDLLHRPSDRLPVVPLARRQPLGTHGESAAMTHHVTDRDARLAGNRAGEFRPVLRDGFVVVKASALVEHQHRERGHALRRAEDDEERVGLDALARADARRTAAGIQNTLPAANHGELRTVKEIALFERLEERRRHGVELRSVDAHGGRGDLGIPSPGRHRLHPLAVARRGCDVGARSETAQSCAAPRAASDSARSRDWFRRRGPSCPGSR